MPLPSLRLTPVLWLASILLLPLPALTLAQQAHPAARNPRRTPASTTAKPMSTEDQAALHSAVDNYDQGNLQAAEPVLRSLAVRYPQDFQTQEALGSLLAEQGQLQEAIAHLQPAAALAPGLPLAHANLGAAYLKGNDVPRAIAELQIAARLEPGNVHTQSNLGVAFGKAHQPAAAARAFSAAAKQDPDNAELRYNWALMLYQASDLAGAATVLRETPEPGMTAPAQALAADIDEQLGHYEQALLHYQAAAKLDPSAVNIYALTLELLRHWTWSQAREIAAYGAAHFPADTRFRVAEGIALYADSKYPEAAEVFSSLLLVDPNNSLYADLLGRSCNAAGDAQSASCQTLDQFAESHPGNAQAVTFAAARILQLPSSPENMQRAERLLHNAVAASPDLPEAHYQLGVLAQQRLQWQQSVKDLEAAIEVRPEYPEAHYRLSRAYAHLGRQEDARKQIELQQQYSRQAKDLLNKRMQEVVTFLLKPS